MKVLDLSRSRDGRTKWVRIARFLRKSGYEIAENGDVSTIVRMKRETTNNRRRRSP